MRKQLLIGTGMAVTACLGLAMLSRPTASAPLPERALAGLRLGRSYLDL